MNNVGNVAGSYKCKPVIKKISVCFILSSISGGESATYELQVSPPNSNGSFCPGNIEFTCIGRGVPIVLNWFINESSVVLYLYDDQTDMFPMNVLVSPVNVTIVSVTCSFTIDIVSTLSSNFGYLRGASIRCGRGSFMSHSTVVEGNGKLSSLDKKCSLLSNFNASFCLAIIELTCIGGGVPIEMFHQWLNMYLEKATISLLI